MTVLGAGLDSINGIDVTGCAVELRSGTDLLVGTAGTGLHAVAAGQLTIQSGASVSAPNAGVNALDYRSDGPAPIVLGSVSPAPTVTPVALPPCP